MDEQLGVSSYSLRQQLGPITVRRRGPDGQERSFTFGESWRKDIDLLEFPRLVKERLGLDAVEVCQFHVPERTPEYGAKLQRALADAGVRLLNMPIDVGNVGAPDAATREEGVREIEGWIAFAADLGAPLVRVNAGSPGGRGGEESAPVEEIVRALGRLADNARGRGVQLLVENHGGASSDPAHLIGLVEAVGADRLKVLLDIGNFAPTYALLRAQRQGQDAAGVDFEPLYASIARLVPYAGLLHAKSLDFDAEGRPLYLDVERALRTAREGGYAGPISIEYEGNQGDPWVNTGRLKELVRRVFG